MIVKGAVKIGVTQYQFEVDEKEELLALHKAIILANPKKTCNCCGNSELADKYMISNKDKEGNIYVNVKCKCGARSKLGLYKTGGFFWHDYEIYQGKQQEEPLPEEQ